VETGFGAGGVCSLSLRARGVTGLSYIAEVHIESKLFFNS